MFFLSFFFAGLWYTPGDGPEETCGPEPPLRQAVRIYSGNHYLSNVFEKSENSPRKNI